MKKIISNMVVTALLVGSVPAGVFAASPETTELPSAITENLVEVVNIEGVDFKYENFTDDSGNYVTRITNLQTNESNDLTSNGNAIYLDGKQIGTIEIIEESTEQNGSSEEKTNWIQMGNVGHVKISWALGTSAAAIVGAIAQTLKIPSSFVKNCLSSYLGAMVASTIGGTVHFTNWYRNLALGQVQYRTDWSFVDSNGKRYGTYTYMSLPSYRTDSENSQNNLED